MNTVGLVLPFTPLMHGVCHSTIFGHVRGLLRYGIPKASRIDSPEELQTSKAAPSKVYRRRATRLTLVSATMLPWALRALMA